MKLQGQRQSQNVEDQRVTPRDISMGMTTTSSTYAAPKGNRPRYDNALNQIRSQYYKKRMGEIQDMMKKGGIVQ